MSKIDGPVIPTEESLPPTQQHPLESLPDMRTQIATATLLLTSMFTTTPTRATPPEKSAAPQLIELAKSNSPQLHNAIVATFDPNDLQSGKAFIGQGPDFFFATESA